MLFSSGAMGCVTDKARDTSNAGWLQILVCHRHFASIGFNMRKIYALLRERQLRRLRPLPDNRV